MTQDQFLDAVSEIATQSDLDITELVEPTVLFLGAVMAQATEVYDAVKADTVCANFKIAYHDQCSSLDDAATDTITLH